MCSLNSLKQKLKQSDHKSPRRKILVLASVVMTFDLYQKKVLPLHKVELHGVRIYISSSFNVYHDFIHLIVWMMVFSTSYSNQGLGDEGSLL